MDLQERVMLERVKLIARLASEGASHEHDREIALNLIVELVESKSLSNKDLYDLNEHFAFEH